MTSPTTPASGGAPPCPDPSVHEKHHRLSEQASTAALYVTHPERNRQKPLGEDGKLSSKSAATSLKYAKPHELPSFPSSGNTQNSASAAAMLAKDYKVDAVWQPEMSKAGSTAALKAHKDGGKLDLWQPSASAAGHSAALLAMKNKGLSPQVDRGYTDTGRNNSLLAATKSHNQGRQRAGSTPVAPPAAYPDSHNSTRNALNAATVSHRASHKVASDGWDSEANQAARITNLGDHMDREMFGEHPPVEMEVAEKKHNAAIRASAVSMAKQMYEYQNRPTPSPDVGSAIGSAGAETAHRRNQSSTSQADLKQEAMRYIHLQDAAHKLAQERLAKVDKELEPGRYREYYGYPDSSPKKSRLSMRNRRKRSSSEGAQDFSDSEDEEHARRIRTQMSQLSTGLNTVDDKKRDDARAKLLAAAEKRVHARMHDMDEQVFRDTGKPSQAMMDEMEAKSRARQEREREEQAKHPGKTHIGGGKFMDQADIEAIAAARLKPTLEEISDNAEKRRARDEEIARENDLRQTEKMEERIKNQEQKAEFRRIRDADKAAAKKEKEERKATHRADKNEAKVRKSDDKRKSRDIKRDDAVAVAGGATLAEVAEHVKQDNDDELPDETKDRPARRSMFGRISEKLKRRDGGEKNMEDAQDHDGEQQGRGEEAETPAVMSDEPEHRMEHEAGDGQAAAGAAVLGAGAAGGVAAEHEEDEDKNKAASLSSTEDESDLVKPPLITTTSAEHTGHHTDAMPSLGGGPRPDLERHISRIETSSEDDDDDDEEEDDEEENARKRGQGLFLPQPRDVADRVVTAPVTDVSEPMPPSPPKNQEADDALIGQTDPAPAPTISAAEKSEVSSSKPSKLNAAAAGAVALITPGAKAFSPPSDNTNAATDHSVTAAMPPPTPKVGTGPGEETSDQPHEKERKGGVKGFFNKIRSRQSKTENKLSKERPSSEHKSEKSFQGGAKYAIASDKDDVVSPVSPSSVGKETEFVPAASGTDVVTSDDPKASGDEENRKTESVSSFRRHDQDPPEVDDVSSSGADEEDVERGRKGRLARKLGFKGKDKSKIADEDVVKQSNTTAVSGEEEQFEEARDHFDEGLAPPPAFAGQPKSESPVRETRFQEEL